MQLTYRLTPCNQYDIGALESWLEHSAQKGLFVQALFPLHAVFSRGRPQRRRYRLEYFGPVDQDGPPREMLDLYGDLGWNYVTYARPFLLFCTCSPGAPEPQTDIPMAAQRLNHLLSSIHKKVRDTVWLFFAAVFVYLLLRRLCQGVPPLLALIYSNSIYSGSFSFLQLCVLLPVLRLPYLLSGRSHLLRLKKQLDEGLPLRHSGEYGKKKLINPLLLYLCPAFLCGVLLVLPFLSASDDPSRAREAFTPLSLQQLQGGQIRYVPTDDPSGYFVQAAGRNLLSPAYWELSQWGISHGDRLPLILDIQWYQLRPAALAPVLAGELEGFSRHRAERLMPHESGPGGSWTTREYARSGVNRLTISRREDGRQSAVVQRGDQVAAVQYLGDADLAQYLDQLCAMVAPAQPEKTLTE